LYGDHPHAIGHAWDTGRAAAGIVRGGEGDADPQGQVKITKKPFHCTVDEGAFMHPQIDGRGFARKKQKVEVRQ